MLPADAAPPPDTRLALRLLAETTWRRRRVVAAAAAAAFVPFLLLSAALAPRYVSTSTLILLLGPEDTVRGPSGSPATPNLAFDPDHILGNESAILTDDDLHRAVLRAIGIGRLYPALLRPPGPLRRAVTMVASLPATLSRLGATPPPTRTGADVAAAEALAAFDSHLDVAASKNASVLTLRFTARDPAAARDTLRVLERLYLARRRALYGEHQTGPLASEVARARRDLADAEASLVAFRAAHGIADYDTERDILLHREGDLAADAADAARDQAVAAARLGVLAGELHRLPTMVPGGTESDRDGRTAPLRDSLDALSARRAAVLALFRADSPEAAAVDDQLARRRAELAAAARAPDGVSGSHAVRDTARDTVLAADLAAEADRGAAAARAAADRVALAAVRARLDALAPDERRLVELATARDARQDDYRALSLALSDEQKNEAVERDAAPGARVATAPDLPIRPRPIPLLLAAAGLAFALFAAAAAALLLHAGRRVVLFAAEIERLGLPVLGRIPADDALAALPPIRPLAAA